MNFLRKLPSIPKRFMGKTLLEYVLKFKESKGSLPRIIPYVSFFGTPKQPPHKKRRISDCEFDHIYWRNPWWKTSFFVQWTMFSFLPFIIHCFSYLNSICVYVCERFCIYMLSWSRIVVIVVKLHWIIVIINGRIVWKPGPYSWYFRLNLKYQGVAVQGIHQNSEKWWLLWGIAWWKWRWGCFSHFLILWPWCQCFWGSSVDRYRSKRVSQMLLVCYNLLNSQNIPINQ